MSTHDDSELKTRFTALAPRPVAGDWDDVLARAGLAPNGRRRTTARREGRRRRRYVVIGVAALLVAVATASAFGTVRELLFGTSSSAWGGAPTWSPDGRRIAFVTYPLPSGRPYGRVEVVVMNADGSGLRNLTDQWGRHIVPLWSPDWRQVAFFRNPCDLVQRACRGNTAIYVMNADGSGLRRLARGGSVRKVRGGQREAGGDGLAWSSDWRRIAFLSDRDGDFDIYVMNADGTGQRNLTRRPGFDGDPVWSPDGRRIAFVSKSGTAHGSPRGIYVMNADGSGQRLLARGGCCGSPLAWSPDGKKIAFRSDRDGNGEIYVIDADGSGERRLTRSPASDGHPSWSPDGRKILFVRSEFRYGNREIYAVNADGSGLRNLSRNLAGDSAPAWSPDGLKIVFVSNRDRHGEIYVMNADGSGQQRLTRLKEGD
jgi:Tol biopolymer transport system component